MSMFEPRVGSLFPTPDELQRKDQVIQNLTDSQRSLNAHNQQLLSKVDELEFHNRRLKDLLTAHNIADETSPRQPARRHRPARAAGLHGDVIRVPDSVPPSAPPSTVVSPNSETSVSGYGSLAGSACGDGYPSADPVTGGREGVAEGARTERVGDYDDDTLPLSAVSADSEDSRKSTPARSASSGDSRGHTLNRDSDRSDIESVSPFPFSLFPFFFCLFFSLFWLNSDRSDMESVSPSPFSLFPSLFCLSSLKRTCLICGKGYTGSR